MHRIFRLQAQSSDHCGRQQPIMSHLRTAGQTQQQFLRHNSSFLSEIQKSVRRQWEENKQLQQNVKLLNEEQTKVAESDAMKNAKQAINATSQATSTVFKAVGSAVDATIQNPVVQGTGKVLYKTAEVVADVSSKVAAPILDTQAAKMVGSGLHQIKRDVVGMRNPYFAEYRPKEERDQERQEIQKEKQRHIKKDEFGNPVQNLAGPIQADDESTGIVMHRTSKIAQAWASSSFAQSLNAYGRKMEENDSPVLRAWRSFREKTTVSETETARVIRTFKQAQPDFDQHVFLKEFANFMIADILDAYLKGDNAILTQWGTEGAFARLSADFAAQKQAGLVSDCKLIDYRNVELSKLTLINEEVPVAIITFQTTEILCFKNKKGEIKLGAEDNIQNARYTLALTKQQILDPESEYNPLTEGWVIMDWVRMAR